ncbi:uncharacterized protein LOC6579226 [Drosophila mojavensis]|uniref:LITAF domain-containing protein n=1 Tax=Drosophila mojavensis TaxID=7230 RepID=A0A0Q9XH87_DROMO|nr:uncharacterized protein LOC6579226 [Drosophila mojavensis]KRG04434.1 uncharacterized protein Dmoj_GI19236 [Drosophila mojavensis]
MSNASKAAELQLDNVSAATATLEQLEFQEELPLKPQLRFYSVGPSTYRVLCPLCHHRSRSETVQMAGALGQLSCLLSALSCCFPIFALSCVYTCLQSRLKSKRVFCSSCGGHLGFHWRPI